MATTRRWWVATAWMTAAIVGLFAFSAATGRRAGAAAAGGPPLAHMVFFTLKDHSKESREKFGASCKKYLTNHPGATYFSLGTIADDVVEPVSVRDFDVALHVVFENKDAEMAYQKSPRHVQFVEENKASFEKVRVFDSYLSQP